MPADVITPTVPLLTTVPRVELGAVGRWNISNIKNWQPSADDMASAVAALGCPAVRRPVLKLGHDGNPGAGDPALGYIDNMAVTEQGQVLVGDYAGIPAWLATVDEQGNSVLSSAYPDRSGEWQHDYVCQLGHTHPFVLHAMALLGVMRPGIGTLQSLHDLYSTAPEVLMPAASLPSSDGVVQSAATTDDVRRAYYAGPGSNWALYIREMYVDPAELIVQNDADDTLTRVSYTVAADGTVTFGDPQPVKVTYVAAMAAASAPLVAYASHAESRPGTPPPPAPPGPPATPPGSTPAASTEKKGAGMDPAKLAKLREVYDLDASASEADVLAAMGADLPAPSAATPPPAEPDAEPDVPAQLAAAAAASGAVVLSKGVWDETQERLRKGEQAAARLRETERDKVLTAALSEGRIKPDERDYWSGLWDSNPKGTEQVLGKLAKNRIPVTATGYTGSLEPDEADPFDALFAPKVGG